MVAPMPVADAGQRSCLYLFYSQGRVRLPSRVVDAQTRQTRLSSGPADRRRKHTCQHSEARLWPLRAALPRGIPSASRWRVRTCEMNELREAAEIQFQGFHRPHGFFILEALSQMNFRAEVTSTLSLKMMQPEGYKCLVVEERDRGAVGGIVDVSVQQNKEVLRELPPDVSSYAYLSSMAISEHLRRQGAARALLKAAERTARDWDQAHLALHLHEDNEPARKLYERAGYRLVNRRTPFLGRTRLLMLKSVLL